MNKIEKLEAQLREEKAKELKRKQDEFLAPFLALNGRAFFFQNGIGGSKKKEPVPVCGFICYGKAKFSNRMRHDTSGELWANLPKRIVYAIAAGGQFDYEGCKVQSKVNNHDDVKNFEDETRHHVFEVDRKVFEAEYLTPMHISKMVADRWIRKVDAPPLSYILSQGDGDLDLPFIKLEGMEGSIVGEPVFRLDNERFLVSPNSKEWVKNKIIEAEETERRCRHLYEDCDRSYVERKEEAMKSLKVKLGI